jgi:hypothetical protein
MISALHSAKVSAQSPPCSRKRLPSCASANCCLSVRISHDVTNGGNARNSSCAAASAVASGYCGSCSAGFARQLPGAHGSLAAGGGGASETAGTDDMSMITGCGSASSRPTRVPATVTGGTDGDGDV